MHVMMRILLITLTCLGAQAFTVPDVEAHGYHRHGGHHGYAGYRYGYPYRHGYPYRYGYPRYGYAPSVSIGYSSFGWSDSWGVGLSFPLYIGSRHAPEPAMVYGPHRHDPDDRSYIPAPRQTCRQEREYQTEIVIGDDVVPAYGTACLQDDGSWKVVSGPFVDGD